MIKSICGGFPYKPVVGCFGYASIIIIESSKTILFDTGGYNLRKEIIKRLSTIDCVVISHLHFDHCSNLDLFVDTDIPIYISKAEMEYYNKNKKNDCDLFSYFDYIKDDLNIVEINDDYELLDNVSIIFTPGHTPGHISLRVTEKNGVVSLLAGDALKTYSDYLNDESYGNAFSPMQYLETKKYIKSCSSIIYPGHDEVIINGSVKKRMDVIEF